MGEKGAMVGERMLKGAALLQKGYWKRGRVWGVKV